MCTHQKIRVNEEKMNQKPHVALHGFHLKKGGGGNRCDLKYKASRDSVPCCKINRQPALNSAQ